MFVVTVWSFWKSNATRTVILLWFDVFVKAVVQAMVCLMCSLP